ncbi:MAG TPA: hypothetical protein VLQ47_09435 [Rhodoferax sp.]|nr:hypothetical protein [Rhodoferax sp.]
MLRQRAEARFAECAMPMPATDLPVWAASWQPDATWRALAFQAPGAIMAVNEVA